MDGGFGGQGKTMRKLGGRMLALALLAAPLAVPPVAAPAAAQSPPSVVRLQADDRVGAAIAWSRYGFADGDGPVVLLARDDVFADSLTSGPLQGVLDGPLLLTPPGVADPRVAAELARLGAEEVVILGGTATGVADYGLRSTRVAGGTRAGTAVAVADAYLPDAAAALLVRTGFAGEFPDETQAFADALSAGAVGANLRYPVLFTGQGALTADTRGYLQRSAITDVVVIGGEDAIGAGVVAELQALGRTVERIAGPNRFATAEALALAAFPEPPASILLVAGQTADAWASAFPAAVYGRTAAVLPTGGPTVPGPALWGRPAGSIPVVCGPLVDAAVCDQAAAPPP